MEVSSHTGGVTAEAGDVGVSEHPGAYWCCGVRGAAPHPPRAASTFKCSRHPGKGVP